MANANSPCCCTVVTAQLGRQNGAPEDQARGRNPGAKPYSLNPTFSGPSQNDSSNCPQGKRVVDLGHKRPSMRIVPHEMADEGTGKANPPSCREVKTKSRNMNLREDIQPAATIKAQPSPAPKVGDL